jgi:hypothetical protein
MTTFIDEFQLSDLTLCDSLLKMFDDAHDRGLTFAGQSGAMGQARPEIKASTDFWLNDCDKLGPPEKYRWPEYQAELNGFIDIYLDKYKFFEYGGMFTSRHLPQIQHYKPGEGYHKWHIDGAQMNSCDRAMVYMTYLNDVTEGGGTMFYHQKVTTKAVKGKTLIFPAAYTHLHKGEISKTQHKYILTGWIWWK